MVSDLETASDFARAAQSMGTLRAAHVHVKIDTGIRLLGFLPG